MKKVVLDIGHGGSDQGATENQLIEKDLNLAVGLAADSFLTEYEVEVVLTRNYDYGLTNDKRVAKVNEENPDLCVSIHHNWASDPKARGCEVIHAHYDTEDDALAQMILMKMAQIGVPTRRAFTKLNDRGSDWYYMIRRIWDSDTKAIIFEGAFLSNADDYALLSDYKFLIREGKVLAEAIVEFLDLQLKIEHQHWAEPVWQQLNENGIKVDEKRFDDSIKRSETLVVANELRLDYTKRMDDLAADIFDKLSDLEKQI